MEVVELIFFAFVALFVLVTVHEFGHYWVARRCGVKVLRFSIGFGPILFRRQMWGTEFAFSAIPLGGYVKMLGEGTSGPDEEVTAEDERLSFSHKTVWQRMAIVLAGPIANFILAVFVYFLVFMGGTRGIAPIIGEVEADSIAASAGLQADTEIRTVDGTSTETWQAVYEALLQRIGDSGQIEIEWAASGSSVTQSSQLEIERWQSSASEPDVLGSLGIEPFRPEVEAIIAEVVDGSAAARAGMEPGDRVVATDGRETRLWSDWTEIVRASPGSELSVTIERDGSTLALLLVPESQVVDGTEIGLAGVMVEPPVWDESLRRDRSFGPASALAAGAEKTWDTSVFVLSMIKKLFSGQVSVKSLGGPISIAKIAGDSADAGWQTFFQFIAMMSVMLGVMNLLPIPVLDGGHFLFYVVEAIKGSPLSETIQGIAMRFGMAAIFGIMLLALYNDFARL